MRAPCPASTVSPSTTTDGCHDHTASPLQAHDARHDRTLKLKVRDQAADVRRHLLALRTAMATFGEDFDLDAFTTAYASDDPVA